MSALTVYIYRPACMAIYYAVAVQLSVLNFKSKVFFFCPINFFSGINHHKRVKPYRMDLATYFESEAYLYTIPLLYLNLVSIVETVNCFQCFCRLFYNKYFEINGEIKEFKCAAYQAYSRYERITIKTLKMTWELLWTSCVCSNAVLNFYSANWVQKPKKYNLQLPGKGPWAHIGKSDCQNYHLT